MLYNITSRCAWRRRGCSRLRCRRGCFRYCCRCCLGSCRGGRRPRGCRCLLCPDESKVICRTNDSVNSNNNGTCDITTLFISTSKISLFSKNTRCALSDGCSLVRNLPVISAIVIVTYVYVFGIKYAHIGVLRIKMYMRITTLMGEGSYTVVSSAAQQYEYTIRR